MCTFTNTLLPLFLWNFSTSEAAKHSRYLFCLYQLLQHAGKVRLPAHLVNSVEEKNLILEVNVYIY